MSRPANNPKARYPKWLWFCCAGAWQTLYIWELLPTRLQLAWLWLRSGHTRTERRAWREAVAIIAKRTTQAERQQLAATLSLLAQLKGGGRREYQRLLIEHARKLRAKKGAADAG